MRKRALGLAAAVLLAAPMTAAAQTSFGTMDVGDITRFQPTVTVSDLANINEMATPGDTEGWFVGGYINTPPAGQDDPRYVVASLNPFGGVARLITSYEGDPYIYGCTGTLLSRRHLLTAAHCVMNNGQVVDPGNFNADFWNWDTTSPTRTRYNASRVMVHPGYDNSIVVQDHDVAVVELSTDAAAWIPTYSLYNGNPLFQEVLKVGFGSTGNGVTGNILSNQFDDYYGGTPVLRAGKSSWEMTMDGSYYYAGFNPSTSALVSDFDGAMPTNCVPGLGCYSPTSLADNNRICNIWSGSGLDPTLLSNLCDTGYGIDEVATAGGDSGGPGFIWHNGQYKIAGVTSFGEVYNVPVPGGANQVGGIFGSLQGHTWTGSNSNYGFIQDSVVPEPATVLLLITGLLGIAGVAMRRRSIGAEG